MPTLHNQLRGKAQDKEGNDIDIPPQVALLRRGPVVKVTVSLEQNMAHQYTQRDEELPAPISGLALIDIGASASAIDEAAAQKMGLPVIDKVNMTSASHKATLKKVYPILIELQGWPLKFNAPRALGLELEEQKILILIGRDLLQHATLFYNGPNGAITLSI